MRRILVDVDTQADFMVRSGALFVEDPSFGPTGRCLAQERIWRMLREASEAGDPIIGSVDSHAYDAWEFKANGGPFPPHCVKGTPGWLRVWHDLPSRIRFIPMNLPMFGATIHVAAGKDPDMPKAIGAAELAHEALEGVGLYFEKEVYSLFSNPAAENVIEAMVTYSGGKKNVVFDVIGYCTGGYCVDAAAKGLAERGYKVRVHGGATVAIGGEDGQLRSKEALIALGIEWVDDPGAYPFLR